MGVPIATRACGERPCLVCGSPSKGCSSTEDGLHLCRGEARHGWKRVSRAPDNAGFEHYRREEDRRYVGNGKPPVPTASLPPRNWQTEAERYARELKDVHRHQLAAHLDLPVSCLAAFPLLGFVEDRKYGPCWTFPEHDASGRVTAICRRVISPQPDQPNKPVMQGGNRGVYLPDGWRERSGPLFAVEGGSDTLALDAAGLPVVGRPNDKGGAEIIAGLLRGTDREVVVVAENDPKPDGKWPGREGAEYVATKLAGLLNRPVKWSLPPNGHKDVRAWVTALTKRAGDACNWGAIGREIREHLEANAQTVNPQPAVAPNASGSLPELIITPLAGMKVRPVRYLVPGRIPLGKLILVAGRGGDGKSTLLRSLAADLSVGRCALGLKYDKPVLAKTLIVAAEDGLQDTILPGLLAEGADVLKIAVIEGVRCGNTKRDFTLSPEHVELVRQRLKASPEIRLVILDPIASFVGRAKIDDHRAAELRLLLDPLSALAESAGVTIVMIAHLNKSSGDAVDRIAGSAAYRDAVRLAYLVCQDPEDESRRLLMVVKENLPALQRSAIPFSRVPLGTAEADQILKRDEFQGLSDEDREAVRGQLARVQFDTAVSLDPDATLKAKKADGTKVQKCKEWLRQFLAKYAFPSAEILAAAKENGYTFDNLKEAKAELKKEGVISHSNDKLPGGWWSGPGLPAFWTARPEPTPLSPHTPHTPASPLSPHTQEREKREEEVTGETGESGEWGGEGRHAPDEPPDAQGVL